MRTVEHIWHLALVALTYLQSLQQHVLRLPSCHPAVTLGDALALHRYLNDGQALRWMRNNHGLFRLIQVTNALFRVSMSF